LLLFSAQFWVPASAGTTEKGAGTTEKGAGATEKGAGATRKERLNFNMKPIKHFHVFLKKPKTQPLCQTTKTKQK